MMARSKAQRASKLKNKENTNNVVVKQENVGQGQENVIKMLLKTLDQEFKVKRIEMRNKLNYTLDALNNISFEEFTACLDVSKTHKTIDEIQKEKSMVVNSTTISDLGRSILKNTTTFKSFANTSDNTADNTLANTGRKKKHTDDEAGESGRSVSNDRTGTGTGTSRNRSRSTMRQEPKKTRVSRSLSRSKLPKNVTIQAPDKKTPERRLCPPTSFGLVTPKVKPNTPLSILRRPKQGEMAISMQGSPLLVSGVVTETCANVNIPLDGGRILSLQPSRSLRMSEIPNLDEDTRQQLRTLCENLNKVVKLAGDC